MGKMDVHFSSKNNRWETPDDLFQELNTKYGPFEIDVAASASNTKCARFYDESMDTFKQEWAKQASKCYMNPPYSRPENACKRNCKKKGCEQRGYCTKVYIPGQIDFVRKAFHESKNGMLVCMLIPARTDTTIYHSYIWNKHTMDFYPWVKFIEYLDYRVPFEIDGIADDPAPFPSMVVVFQHGNE